MKNTCPHCGSNNITKMSRIVGYFSKVHNWSKSKQEEKRDREKSQSFYSVTKKDEE